MKRKPTIVKGKYPTEKEKRKLERLILKRLKKNPMSVYQLKETFNNASSILIASSLFRLIARSKVIVTEERELQRKTKSLRFYFNPLSNTRTREKTKKQIRLLVNEAIREDSAAVQTVVGTMVQVIMRVMDAYASTS